MEIRNRAPWSTPLLVALAAIPSRSADLDGLPPVAVPVPESAAEPAPQSQPDASQPAASQPAATTPATPSASREPAADGTTSVVVPPPDEKPRASPVPAGPPSTPGSPPGSPPPVTGGPQGTAVADPAPAAPQATDLLADMLAPQPARADAALYARPLTLVEALERSGDRTRRLWIVQAYWKVATAHAAVRSGWDALERLELVAPGGDPHDRIALDVAAAAARAEFARARAELGTAQQELVDLVRLPVGEPLPWPVDRPLATPYQTHFEAIFANRIATGRVRGIARALPLRHDAVEARAAAVRAAGRAVELAEADHARGQRPIEAVLAAHAALATQKTEFLAAVRSYNLDIAEYAMAVAELSTPDDRFVSMLIGTPIQVRPPADSTPAAAPSRPTPGRS